MLDVNKSGGSTFHDTKFRNRAIALLINEISSHVFTSRNTNAPFGPFNQNFLIGKKNLKLAKTQMFKKNSLDRHTKKINCDDINVLTNPFQSHIHHYPNRFHG